MSEQKIHKPQLPQLKVGDAVEYVAMPKGQQSPLMTILEINGDSVVVAGPSGFKLTTSISKVRRPFKPGNKGNKPKFFKKKE